MRSSPRTRRIAVLAFLGSAICALALSVSCAVSCSSPFGAAPPRRTLTLMSYNVLSLFDAVDDGTEYPEFSVAKGGWDEVRYRRRLDNLAKVVREGGEPSGAAPDLVCLLEVEKPRVLEDLLAGPLKSAGYRCAAMAPAPGAAVNAGLISRLPIVSLRAHAVSGSGASRSGRYVLEAAVDVEGSPLTMLLCHWKSKLEGAEPTEDERRQEAALVEGRVSALLAADPEAAVVVCGDFNENPDEYLRVGKRYATALMPAEEARSPNAGRLLVAAGLPGSAAGDPAGAAPPAGAALSPDLSDTEPAAAGVAARSPAEPVLYSPWAGAEGFSYAYKGARERIDGFLLSASLARGGRLAYRDFSVLDAPFLLDASGLPLKWSSFSGSGYSDHLPILLGLDVATRQKDG
ncbi:MAG: endonuclease/exonuclease/phosphatase family protein [Treponema sp.]|nr:endonuclease/exonuclease/phosphatase family protein [Treponema sp.]